MAHVFISYRQVKPDRDLAVALYDFLKGRGVDAFLDRDIPIGKSWEKEIGSHLEAAHYFIVILSEEAIRSEWVLEESRRACERRRAGTTTILPIWFAGLKELPLQLGTLLNSIQRVRWDPADGFGAIAQQMYEAIHSGAALPESGREAAGALAVDSLPPSVREGAPLPAAEARIIVEAGAMRLASPFYVRRAEDGRIEEELSLDIGRTIVIKGPRQSGKSSLLVRVRNWAVLRGMRCWYLDMQRVETGVLATLDYLLRNLAERMQSELPVSVTAGAVWNPALGAVESLSRFVQEGILQASAGQVVFCIDEVDRVFAMPYRNDFFAMLRNWHNERAYSPVWDRLSLVLSHSSDPAAWIDDMNQSPFNVAELSARLPDFTRDQAADLNTRYGRPLKQEPDLDRLLLLVGGQPYMVRQALYTLKKEHLSLESLEQMATRPESPFADHLRRHFATVERSERLRKAVRQILREGRCEDDLAFQSLYSSGLATGEARRGRLRSLVYERYFQERL